MAFRFRRLTLGGMGLAFVLLFGAAPAWADLVVVANAHGQFGQLTREEVINIYMGRYRRLADGSAAVPYDLEAASSERKAFYRRLLDKSLEEINAYWARLVFSGRTAPPGELAGPEQLLARIAADPHAIGYLDRRQLSQFERGGNGQKVKVIFSLPD